MEGEERRAIQVQKLAANLLEVKRNKRKIFPMEVKGSEKGEREKERERGKRERKGRKRRKCSQSLHSPPRVS